jgi:hypothetical protein
VLLFNSIESTWTTLVPISSNVLEPTHEGGRLKISIHKLPTHVPCFLVDLHRLL